MRKRGEEANECLQMYDAGMASDWSTSCPSRRSKAIRKHINVLTMKPKRPTTPGTMVVNNENVARNLTST